MMGVIQEKYTLADVICQHKIDGSIIPLKIRITDEDGEYQVYNIKILQRCIESHSIYLCPTEHRLPRPTIFGNLNVRLVYLTR